MKGLRDNLLVQFSVSSFTILAVIGLVLGVVLSKEIRDDAINDLTNEIVEVTARHLLTVIDAEDLETPMTGARYDGFHDFAENIVSSRTGGIARIKVWSKDGTVIYSSDMAGVGERFLISENLQSALDGEVSFEIEVPEGTENEREKFLGTLIEVYSPIVFDGSDEPRGAFEIYQYYQPTADRIDSLRRLVMLSISLGFLILYGSLVSIVWRGWRTINRQQTRLEAANEQLKQEMLERKQLQEQLVQSQKMEAIGTLAGGVAHDFNNMLSAILSYAHLASVDIEAGKPVASHIDEIRKAGERSAGLTKQLLAFSRRQIFSPEVTNLNHLISGIESMLVRTIGEHVRIQTRLAPDLSSVLVDRSQIEQVITNMAVNSRDALPNGGTVILETSNTYIDESATSSQPELEVGPYVTLKVIDDGAGIPDDILPHIFEPFYTSKEMGKGTGLGLSMSHGIIAQSGGHIAVTSELGTGTTFTMYFPAVDAVAERPTGDAEYVAIPEGNESVLLVEDEPIVRRVATKILVNQGYSVEEATNGQEALEVLSSHPESHFDILITDVVMPLMGGIELVEHFRETHPHTNVLYMTGYTDDDIINRDIPDNNCSIIQKPFTPNTLAQQVREILDQA